MYPAEVVSPMKGELTAVGFAELTSPEAVDAWVDSTKESTGMIPSV